MGIISFPSKIWESVWETFTPVFIKRDTLESTTSHIKHSNYFINSSCLRLRLCMKLFNQICFKCLFKKKVDQIITELTILGDISSWISMSPINIWQSPILLKTTKHCAVLQPFFTCSNWEQAEGIDFFAMFPRSSLPMTVRKLEGSPNL